MLLLLLLPLLPWGTAGRQDLRYRLEVRSSVKVQEGLCELLPCRVFYPQEDWSNTWKYLRWTDKDPAFGYWFREGADIFHGAPVATNHPNRSVQEETRSRFHLLGEPQDNNCSLDIRDAQRRDKGTYFFRVERGPVKWSYYVNKLSVQVTALKQTPQVHIPGPLESGRPSNLTCSAPWACKQGTPPTFSWTAAALTSLGPGARQSPVLTLTPRPQDHGANLTCRVTLPGAGVTVKTTVQLNVSYSPRSLAVSVVQGSGAASSILGNGSSLPVQQGQSLRLICVADSNPPSRLSWARGSLTLSPPQPSDPGVLELPRVRVEDEGQFTCRAENLLGAQHISVSLSLQRTAWLGVLLGAVVGAGVTALLFISSYLIFTRVRAGRKKATGQAEGLEDATTVTGSVSQDHLTESQADAPPCAPPPAVPAPSPGEEEEPYYASLIFQEMGPRRLQEQETTCEYSEITVHNFLGKDLGLRIGCVQHLDYCLENLGRWSGFLCIDYSARTC
ncbi:sialic acid-binding Ig-like lectin 13 isoform X2 [Tamandua tetradactyla]|uniref:sialic acid-binding Ig-like lectin 13 isoform X2 n=1 Tax=Tamandua tetradactyla TaxID=48850 RepID=UPI004053B98C